MPVCEICNGKDFDLIATKIREGTGRILQCNNCGLITQGLDWDSKQLRNYYEDEYQRTNSLVSGTVQSPLEHFQARLQTIQPVFEQIHSLLTPETRVLEIGCGAGALLSLIKPHVAKCVGIELNKTFSEFINENLGIEAYSGSIDDAKFDYKFDLIISIATLDHLPSPYETLVTMRDLLAPDGKIYIEVPNRNEGLNHYIPSPNREMFNKFFWHRAHLFYFTKATITALFKKAGLNVSISCRHDYTLKNFLNWYFLGKPQSGLVTGMLDSRFFYGKSDFEVRMEKALSSLEEEFKMIMLQTFCGDNLCCIGWL